MDLISNKRKSEDGWKEVFKKGSQALYGVRERCANKFRESSIGYYQIMICISFIA